MPIYSVEVIHETTGMYMNFEYESDAPHEDALCSEILSDLSVVTSRMED